MRRIAAATAILALLAGGCAAPAGSSRPPADDPAPAQQQAYGLLLTFEGLRSGIGDPAHPIENSGSWQVRIKTLTADGGAVSTAHGRAGGLAVRFPAAGRAKPAPAAVIRLDRVHDADDPQPGTRRFRIGADFQLDPDSSRGEHDNGDNIVQRGLWGDPHQYKIQVDHGRPSCLVRGQAGEVFVQADVTVNREDWYRLTCERRSRKVILRLVRFHSDGTRTADRWQRIGRTGRMDLDQTPLSVGGKVSAQGRLIRSAGDQFNGRLDRVFFSTFG